MYRRNVAAVNEEYSQPVKAQPPVDETPAAHDDFDWSVDKRNVIAYNKDERTKYDKVYDETFRSVADNEMVTGLVVGLTKTDAVINIGFKSDGLISLNEFRDAPIKVGDEVEVMVVEKEDRQGNLHLSRKQARTTVHGNVLWMLIKPAKLLPVPLPVKPRAALLWTYLVWKPSCQDLRLT
jgi:small subunit ribosomal protein S1